MALWLICECAGVVCVVITYLTVLTVQLGMIRIGLWERLMAGDIWAYIHLGVFQYHVALIFISHVKCMMSEPGVLPRKCNSLDFRRMGKPIQESIIQLRDEVKHMAKDIDLDGPTEVKQSTMSLDE
jgi:hypothetical protein